VVGVFATNHQPQVLPPYFAARKENPVLNGKVSTVPAKRAKQIYTYEESRNSIHS
jgi:hypothetical protein